MSDLPNFEKFRWLRRLRTAKVVAIVAAILLSAIAWTFAGELPEGVSVEMKYPAGTKAIIGQQFPYAVEIKNNNDRTVSFNLQVAFYVRSTAECVGAGAALTNSFSLPQVFSVVPNASKTISLGFDVAEHCEIVEAVPKIFSTVTRDNERTGVTIIAEPIHVL